MSQPPRAVPDVSIVVGHCRVAEEVQGVGGRGKKAVHHFSLPVIGLQKWMTVEALERNVFLKKDCTCYTDM